MKRIIALFFVLCLFLVPITAFAEETDDSYLEDILLSDTSETQELRFYANCGFQKDYCIVMIPFDENAGKWYTVNGTNDEFSKEDSYEIARENVKR